MLVDILLSYMGPFITIFASMYICGILLSNTSIIFNRKSIIIILISSFLIATIYFMTDNFIKIIFNFLALALSCRLIFKINAAKSFVLSFIVLISSLISEILYTIIIITIFNIDLNTFKLDFFGTIATNVLIASMAILIVRLKCIFDYLVKFINQVNIPKYQTVVITSVLSILCMSMLIYYIYFKVPAIYGFTLSFIFVGIYVFLTFSVFQEKGQNYKLQTKYETMLNSLSEYEKLYSYQRMLNHEFKNDLMVIRGMAYKNNTKLLNYIDQISNFKNKKEEKWLNLLKRIPEGGLLGLLYYKLLSMEEENINISFNIGTRFETNDYISISDDIKNKICKLLGIYFDNAIDAVKNLKTKNVSIKIDKIDEKLVITICNNFEGKVDISQIYDKGYTTNGKGRGFGLAIAKDIFEHDSRIENYTQINNNIFIQRIKIKI